MAAYLGLIELAVTVIGMTAFGVWQLWSLKRDRAITEARLRAGREASAPPAGDARHAEGQERLDPRTGEPVAVERLVDADDLPTVQHGA